MYLAAKPHQWEANSQVRLGLPGITLRGGALKILHLI